MNYTRGELLQHEAVMNQMRNAIYFLGRYMIHNGVSEVTERFRRMGRNIARTYSKYWIPTDIVSMMNLRDFIVTIYKKVFNSTVSLNFDAEERTLFVKDNACPLCKYHYNDIEQAGCEIILGFISEYTYQINNKERDSEAIYLEPIEVKDSQSYGHKSCLQLFKIKRSSEVNS